MSEVLMEFVDPYTVHAGAEEQWRKLLGVAVIAWNASMFLPAERKGIVDGPINHEVTSMPEEAKELSNGRMGSEGQVFFTI
jgi:hypothetical protein